VLIYLYVYDDKFDYLFILNNKRLKNFNTYCSLKMQENLQTQRLYNIPSSHATHTLSAYIKKHLGDEIKEQ